MTVAKARRLRKEMTGVERKLWQRLRGNELGNIKFRRQHPLGPYVLDFFCESLKLVIELDGGQHAEARRDHDLKRSQSLEARGCHIFRFWNHEVVENIEGVLDRILVGAESLKKARK